MIKKEKGITIIALVITIIVLLILAGISIATLTGDNGIITKAQLSKFAEEMKTIEENVKTKKLANEIYQNTGDISEDVFKQLDINDSNIDLPDTLKQEILYIRDGMPSDTEPSNYEADDFDEMVVDGKVEDIYIIDKETGNNKENTYIYDEKTGVAFKIPQTTIGGKVYHSYDCAISAKGSLIGESVNNNKIITEDSKIAEVNGISYYAPDLSGFDSENTYMVYYSSDFSNTEKIVASKYIEDGQQNEITEGNDIYTLHDYKAKTWANVVTSANGVESWWVWIPRYAYKINGTGDISIAFIDTANNDLNDTQDFEEYIVHSAFEGNDLKGIWMSKFEPTSQGSIQSDNPSNTAYGPDMDGYDTQNTYMVYYSQDFSQTYKMKLSEYNSKGKPRTTEVSGETYTLYDYGNHIWANIVTNANGVEAWWVWIPRYAYNTEVIQTGEMSIIFVDTKDKPYDTSTMSSLPKGYEVHSAFKGNTLKGIWMSKFEPTSQGSIQSDDPSNTAYGPDMDGFDTEYTYMVYYSPDFSQTYKMKLSEYNSKGKPRTTEVSGETYTLYDYGNHIWANIVTNANGVEAWWVWIPRYAYSTEMIQTGEMSIIFVDTNNKPYDTSKMSSLPDGYEVHSAFNGNDLKGIWMSKFEPTYDSSTSTTDEDIKLK